MATTHGTNSDDRGQAALLDAPDFLQVPIDHKAPTGYSVDCTSSMVATG